MEQKERREEEKKREEINKRIEREKKTDAEVEKIKANKGYQVAVRRKSYREVVASILTEHRPHQRLRKCKTKAKYSRSDGACY